MIYRILFMCEGSSSAMAVLTNVLSPEELVAGLRCPPGQLHEFPCSLRSSSSSTAHSLVLRLLPWKALYFEPPAVSLRQIDGIIAVAPPEPGADWQLFLAALRHVFQAREKGGLPVPMLLVTNSAMERVHADVVSLSDEFSTRMQCPRHRLARIGDTRTGAPFEAIVRMILNDQDLPSSSVEELTKNSSLPPLPVLASSFVEERRAARLASGKAFADSLVEILFDLEKEELAAKKPDQRRQSIQQLAVLLHKEAAARISERLSSSVVPSAVAAEDSDAAGNRGTVVYASDGNRGTVVYSDDGAGISSVDPSSSNAAPGAAGDATGYKQLMEKLLTDNVASQQVDLQREHAFNLNSLLKALPLTVPVQPPPEALFVPITVDDAEDEGDEQARERKRLTTLIAQLKARRNFFATEKGRGNVVGIRGSDIIDWIAINAMVPRHVASRLAQEVLALGALAPAAPSNTIAKATNALREKRSQTILRGVLSDSDSLYVVTLSEEYFNNATVWAHHVRAPHVVATDVLARAMNLAHQHIKRSGPHGVLDRDSILVSPQWKELQISICELQRVPLHLLSDANRKLSFWLNVYNLMLLHCVIVRGYPSSDAIRKPRKWLKSIVYRIDGSEISADEIYTDILRGSSSAADVVARRLIAPCRRFALSPFDPRIHFGLWDATRSSPEMMLFHADSVQTQLALATRRYLDREISLSESQHTALFPAIMETFKSDFPRSGPELVLWSGKFLDTDRKQKLSQMIGSDLVLKYRDRSTDFVAPRLVNTLSGAL